jgi:D-3-phosphoglycerate dehydrogenase
VQKVRVLLINPTIQPCGVEILTSGAEIIMAPDGKEDTLASYLSSADVVAVVTRVERITRRIIENAPGLRVIGQHGVGVDNIDVKAATDLGVLVINAPTANFVSVAEHAVMLMLALSRRLSESDAAVRRDDFGFRERFYPMEINGKILFAVGLGRVGSEVAKKCRLGFNMEVLGHDPLVSELEMAAIGVKKIDLISGLKEADFVSLHLPLTQETRHFIGEKEIFYMKPDAFLINVSRGGVIKQDALFNALKESRIRGAGVDVFDPEPPSPTDALLKLPNVIFTPHFAGDTYEAKQRCSRTIANEVLAVLNGGLPKFLVNPEVFKNPNSLRRILERRQIL